MRYFENRHSAGVLLAANLKKYKSENCAIVALSEGGIIVSIEIAKMLHSSLFLLVTEDVKLPGEEHKPVATVSSSGSFTYNNEYSTGELEAINADYHTVIEQQRMLAFQKLNRIGDDESKIPKALLKNHIVIFVSDGLRNGLSLDVAADFIKPIKVKKIITAVPVASAPAVDRMHLLSDEIQCLSVVGDYMGTDHYYKENIVPEHNEIIKSMKDITLNWR
jgi:predicted phosphoribosyltransferase